MSKVFVSVEKVLDVLTLFDFETPEISAHEISERLNLPLSSVYKYLEVLLKKGFLAKSPNSKKFILGLSIFQMLNVCIVGMKLTEIALPKMEFLRDKTEETVLLTVAKGWEAIVLEILVSHKLIKISLDRGETKPLYAGADGKVVLAFQEPSFYDNFCQNISFRKYTKHTPIDCAQLREQLTSIRQRGVAFSDSELDVGAVAASAPIFDHKKKLAAALTIAGPKERASEKDIALWGKLVVDKANMISHELGFRGKRPC